MRFSLRALILGVVVFGLIATAGFLAWENQGLRARVAEQNEKLGILEVSDTTKIQVVQIENLEDKWWRWKVYLPAGRYRFSADTKGIESSGFPKHSGFMSLVSSGSVYVLDVKIRLNAEGKWSVVKGVDGAGSSGRSSNVIDNPEWITMSATTSTGENGAYDPADPVELLRRRAQDSSNASKGLSVTDPAPGLLVWIERETK